MSTVITDSTFDAEVLQSSTPVLVDFWAPWCGPCRAMLPIMEELEKQYVGKVKIVKMNVDESMEIPGKYNVLSIPTFLIVKGGQVADQFVGSKTKEEMVKKLDEMLK